MQMLDAAPRLACNSNDQPAGPHHLAGTGEPAQGITDYILIIEDHPMVLGLLQASLQRLWPNAEQVCVGSASAALEVLDRVWLRVFVDPEAAGVGEGLLAHEFARLGLACISTRMPIDEFNEVLVRTLEVTAPKNTLREKPAPLFTPRHVELLRLLRRGLQNKAIAHELGIAEGTVRNHLHLLMKRLGVRNRTQAVQAAVRFGIA